MRTGIFQCAGGALSITERLARLHDAIAGKQSNPESRLELVVCPELFASGYNVGDSLLDLASPAHGDIFEQFAALAKMLDVAIVYGYPEQGDGCIYNSAAFVSARGELLANHRKQLNSPGSFEEKYFTPGDRFTMLNFAGVAIAIMICYEVEFPESVRMAAARGAELVFVPTALFDQWGVFVVRVVPTRAFENGIWLAYANHAGHENGLDYLGSSKIVAPDGHIEANAGPHEELIVAMIDRQRVQAAQKRLPYLRDCKKYSRNT